jgi:hypothetical protein
MQLSSLVLMTLGELLLVTTITSILMLVMAVVRKKRDRSAAGALIARIKEGEGRRETETRALLQQNLGQGRELLETLVKKVGREEKRFYQTLINLYLKRDAGALENLQVAFEGATEPYRTLKVPQRQESEEIVPVVVESAVGDDSAEVARLKDENEKLSEELRITMDTMGRMLSEYSSMYAGGDGEELDKEKMLEMFRADAINARAREKQASPAAAQQPAVAEDGDEIHPVNEAATLHKAMTDAAGEGFLAGSGVADLQSKMDDLGMDIAVATGGEEQPLMAADDDLMALNDSLEEIVPEQGTGDEQEETELIDLDAVLVQRT